MPINFQEVYARIQEIGKGARERKKTLEERRAKARELLAAYGSELDLLRSKLDAAKQADANIRSASPLNESLASSHPARDAASDAVLIAADGSQINPDRHAAIQFCLINVGAISMKLNSGETPEIFTESELLYGDDLLPNGIPMSEGMVALRRDLAERITLDELSKGIKGDVITMTDGPIELWGAKGEDAAAYNEFIQKYLTILSRLQSRGVIVAGYVDKPAADLVIRLLEIAMADNEQIQRLREFHPLRGVSDRWLFGEYGNPLLGPGERSAVFGMQSSSEKNYKGALSLHFFYLNVGTDGHPWPVRVEIPKWVADDADKLNLLHATLVSQCRVMGAKPYPYLLHRAHETAVVKMEEKQQIEQLLALELHRNNEDVDDGSFKQSAKDLQGRTRR
ncbi:MAG: DNA double-strand break repair nuclease NurA [Chloroflexota bacterium]